MSDSNTVRTDLLIIGAGPAGLAAAIHAADRFKDNADSRKIMVIEKGKEVGSHILSGAVLKTEALRELLNDEEFHALPFDSEVMVDETFKLSESGSLKLPMHLPYMNNAGNQIASLGAICRYLATLAEARGVEIYSGFAVDDIWYEEGKVVGVKTKDTGVDHQGKRLKNFQEGTKVRADITIFAEGSHGSLAQKLLKRFDLDGGKNPQIYSLGIKELWSVPQGRIEAGTLYHTFGYPLRSDEEFGGGFIYGLQDNKVALGLVVGLDYADPTFDIHAAMQVWKQHPKIADLLKDGSLMEYGAKTLPEGGYLSMPKLYDDNFMIVGYSAGLVAMPALKGVHLAVTSGMCAAKTAVVALFKKDTTSAGLSRYAELIEASRIHEELYAVRNFRQSFQGGLFQGAMKFGVQLLSRGSCPFSGDLKTEPDETTLQPLSEYRGVPFKERFAEKLHFDKKLTFDKVTSVFYSKAMHDEEQVPHLHINDLERFKRINIGQYGAPCQYFCPAEVYELHVDKEGDKTLRIHAENCVHCKTCDIKSPANGITWSVPYGGDGPDYDYM